MVVSILVVVFFLAVISINGSINKANLRINKLEDELANMKQALKGQAKTNKVKAEMIIEEKKAEIIIEEVVRESVKKPAAPKQPKSPRVEEKVSFWAKLEKLFAGNATGVIGVTAVIIGIIFLAIYAAINMGPLARFIVVCGFSVFFYGLYLSLKRYSFWESIALWLRTASGVVFLVGCIGASQFTYMKWIYDDMQAWLFIVLGVFVNIAFGALSKKELFATVHVVLSLFALLLIPFTYLSFVIAAAICFIGMLMTLGSRKWDVHIAVVNASFMLLNIFWAMNYYTVWPSPYALTIALCLFVALPCILSHYRKIYQGWDNKALISHIIIWAALGINLYIHSRGSIWSTIGLGIGAFATFALSYYGNKIKAEWLYVCDRMVSLALGVLTCTSLYKFDFEYYQMAFYASIFSVIFLKLNTYVKNKMVFNINNFVVLIGYIVFIPLLFLSETVDKEMFMYIITSYVVNIVLYPSIENFARREAYGFEIDDTAQKGTSTFMNLFFALHIITAAYLTSAIALSNGIWFIAAFLMGLSAIFFKGYYKNALVDSTVAFIAIVTSAYYMILIYFKKYDLWINVELAAIVIITGAAMLRFSWSEKLKRHSYKSGILILWSLLMFAAYKFTIPYSTMLTSVLWLLVFLIGSDIKEILWKNTVPAGEKGSPAYLITMLSKVSFILFIVRFCLVDLGNHTMLLDVLPARFATEILSLLALVYWMVFGTKLNGEYIKKCINGMLEAFLVLASFYIFAEVRIVEQGTAFAILALVSLFVGPKLGSYNRVTMYSFLLFFIALANVGFVSSSSATPSRLIYDQVWFRSMITVVLSVIFALSAYRKLAFIEGNELAALNKLALSVKSLLVKYDARVLIYPLFLAIAFFLYRGFDKSILSVLWMVECFVLFMISIIIGRSEYRVVSMYGVAGIFIRIMFFDLRGQDFLIKAVIFIIIGCILITMNAIYNKYKYRYEK
ncbi:MAG: hypothetical protein LBR70_04660 [Lactobacillaceae bacterium]|jgi:hypothetical protein|nr:hypothetical protein [Lactobacillaceae bacterium]